ncbi:transcription elongation factor GreB [Ectothiorhodospira marina]|uniref:Transcription elongation factor GreB n=1 Tax=Ectothiorhodospira marina TaxID=1396821 RepID=A0A1H7J4I1_9GAMM|nr:transcription elongation factor GreB [Ectothiorhodospira marina]SEK69102.1 transcription elongation factor GreB [Ectothiorhodospira marina]
MARWRPPQPRSSPYITPEGHATLEAELQGLWTRRADVTRHLSAAAAEGDRSENAEYIYRKKELREIDRRIRYLQKRLPSLQVVRDPPTDQARVFFGAWVTLADASGREVVYRIVGADEFDPERGWISLDSPVARALLGKHLDDEVEVETPGGVVRYEVVDVAYRGAEASSDS